LTTNTAVAVIIPALGMIGGKSLNQEPVPGVAKRPLIANVRRTPNDIDAAHDAKKIEPIELRTTSINSSGLPAHEVSSREYLVAVEIAKWKPITTESNIVNSSFLPEINKRSEDTAINAKVNPSNGSRIENSIKIYEINIINMEIREFLDLVADADSPNVFKTIPRNAAKAAITGKIRRSTYPSLSIPPFAT
jgi:hypothetical protein